MFNVAVIEGWIYHATSKRRRQVVLSPTLRHATLQAIDAVRRLLETAQVPPAVLLPRCEGCSLRAVCLPELTGAEASLPRQQQYQRLLSSQE